MVLIDALYINVGGGKVLLDYLITKLEETGKSIYYLLDDRIEGDHPPVKAANRVQYSKASLLARRRFYKEYGDGFSTVLCFGNLPPSIKIRARVYTYLQSRLYMETPKGHRLTDRIMLNLKKAVFRTLKDNTDEWLVQTGDVAKELALQFKIDRSKIRTLPFFIPASFHLQLKKKHQYIYAGNAPLHKNHLRLIPAFCKFYDAHQTGTLILTVDRVYEEVFNLIEVKKQEGYPILNLGFIPSAELEKIVAQSEFAVYPSLTESFGLGIIEAVSHNCKVIGADLAYMHEVCRPTITFNPYDTDAIAAGLSLSLQDNLPESVLKVRNEIFELIHLLD